jgi:hypothetical protein
MKFDLQAAHKHSSRHREEILSSEICGCFHCKQTFLPSEIEDWTDEIGADDVTALCPKCGIDSVIGSASGFPLTKDFLQEMHQHWF